MTRSSRWPVLAAALGCIALPAVVVPIQAAAFFAANRHDGAFVSSGERREYVLHVPARYKSGTPTPLVISLHGAGLWAAVQRDISQWDRVADAEGFIVVYPSGAGGRGLRVWHSATASDADSRDVVFIGALIDTLAAHYTIDPARVYANGLSNGGGMSFVLSCTMPDRIAAVGLVGAAELVPWNTCGDKRPVPMINFHGTDDTAAPYEGGSSWVVPAGQTFPHQLTWTANWAKRNGCAPQPRDSSIAADVDRRWYTGCVNDAAVELYTIRGGGHTWPGGGDLPEWFTGRTTHSIDASRLMWEFFRAHPLHDGAASR